jgi:hypothetical protein
MAADSACPLPWRGQRATQAPRQSAKLVSRKREVDVSACAGNAASAEYCEVADRVAAWQRLRSVRIRNISVVF